MTTFHYLAGTYFESECPNSRPTKPTKPDQNDVGREVGGNIETFGHHTGKPAAQRVNPKFDYQEPDVRIFFIKQNQSTIKTLEIDKADLFQKMVHLDEQVRSEMLEKFRRDKMEMEEDWLVGCGFYTLFLFGGNFADWFGMLKGTEAVS